MLRRLLVLALAFAPAAVVGCTRAATAEVELARPLIVTTVDDPQGALKRVAEAVRADPQSGLDVAELDVAPTPQASGIHETFVTGPEKHVLEDYLRTHPELAPPAAHQFGYERLRDPEGRGYWRMHCVKAGGLVLRKLVAAELVEGSDGRPRIHVRLGPDDARDFATITSKELGKKLAVVQDNEVLMAPVIHEALVGGEFEISLGAVVTRGEAEAALNHLLGR